MKKTVFVLVLMANSLAAIFPAALDLSVTLEQPILEAGKSQRTYLKVGLKGGSISQNDRPPLNLALVIDRSGSMDGEKMSQAREAALFALELLGERDFVSLVTYESEVEVLWSASPAVNKAQIARLIRGIHPAGSTALYSGVSVGAEQLRKHFSRNNVNRVILISDGLANVGPGSPHALGELGRTLGRDGISVTTIGLGLGYNEDLMTRLASTSDGNHAFVENPRDLVSIFQREFRDAMAVSAGDVELRIRTAGGVRPIRILGRDGTVSGNEVFLRLNQVYGGQEKYVLIEVEIPAGSVGRAMPIANVQVTYNDMIARRRIDDQGSVSANFSSDTSTARGSIVADVVRAVAEQKTVEASTEALRLRDEGNVVQAQEVLKVLNEDLVELQQAAPSAAPALGRLQVENAATAESLGDDEDYDRVRKSERERAYQYQNQMME